MFVLDSSGQACQFRGALNNSKDIIVYLFQIFISAKGLCSRKEIMMHLSKWKYHQGVVNWQFVFGDKFIHKNALTKYVVRKQGGGKIEQKLRRKKCNRIVFTLYQKEWWPLGSWEGEVDNKGKHCFEFVLHFCGRNIKYNDWFLIIWLKL